MSDLCCCVALPTSTVTSRVADIPPFFPSKPISRASPLHFDNESLLFFLLPFSQTLSLSSSSSSSSSRTHQSTHTYNLSNHSYTIQSCDHDDDDCVGKGYYVLDDRRLLLYFQILPKWKITKFSVSVDVWKKKAKIRCQNEGGMHEISVWKEKKGEYLRLCW